MTAEKIDVVALHCDQGMGTLIRFYDGINRLTNIVLVDLGAERGREGYAGRAVAAVHRAIGQMVKDKQQPRIDRLVISHQDWDHWSLLPDLRKKIVSDYPTTQVGPIHYGGTAWKDSPTDELDEWVKQFGTTSTPMADEHSDYKVPGTKGQLFSVAGVAFRVLGVNAPWTHAQENSTSAVIVVEFGKVHVVLPGDATADTAGFINDLVYEPWKTKGKGNPTTPCRAMQVPHHGALRTIASNFTTTMPDLGIGQEFADNIAAQNVVASAGYLSRYKHPHEVVLEMFGENAVTDAAEHDYVVYVKSTGTWKHEVDTERGWYTTVQSLTDPPVATSWMFSITKTGQISFALDWETAGLAGPPGPPRAERYAARPRTRTTAR